uniref:Uncharacterized protein n=1 Tax=Zea mays TaxID=4577 RepID=B6TCB6_MAIZE|nr:hypothetical protein [Zea mays]
MLCYAMHCTARHLGEAKFQFRAWSHCQLKKGEPRLQRRYLQELPMPQTTVWNAAIRWPLSRSCLSYTQAHHQHTLVADHSFQQRNFLLPKIPCRFLS